MDEIAAANAANEMKGYAFHSPNINTRYPHWVNFVREELEKQYDAQTIYRSGFIVYTTLDPVLQDEAQRLVTEQVALADKNAHNGALVSIRPSTGEILAMVGSPDFNNDAISGQVNMATAHTPAGFLHQADQLPRRLRKGLDPATLIWDVPSEFRPPATRTTTRPIVLSTTMGTSTVRSRSARRWPTRSMSRRSRRWISSKSMMTRARRKGTA